MEFKDFFFDAERVSRTGFTEVIFCLGKSAAQLLSIIREMREKGSNIFGTRCSKALGENLSKTFSGLRYEERSQTFQWVQKPFTPVDGCVAVVAAGSADLSVAEEAVQTLQFYGVEVKRVFDVGVAGLHRLVRCLDEIKTADVVIVTAGMEGALPSVLGGLIVTPIIAVPTSVGYGTHFGGLTPLAAMLASCAEGIVVVNIDNGFGAACAALRILKTKNA